MTKRGNKQQFSDLNVPLSAEFATKFKEREQVKYPVSISPLPVTRGDYRFSLRPFLLYVHPSFCPSKMLILH